MSRNLSARAAAILPPECRQITNGAQGVGAWRPDESTPATSTQHQLAAVGLAVSVLSSALSDVLETLVSMGVDRRVIHPFSGAIDNVTAAGEGVVSVARKFAELYGAQMEQEDQPVRPLRVPAGRAAA